MNIQRPIYVLLMIVSAGLFGCASSADQGADARIEFHGTAGAPVTGYYVQNGKRVELDAAIPTTLPSRGVSQFAVRKTHPADDLIISVRTPEGSLRHELSPGRGDGLRVQIAGGLNESLIGPDESLAPNQNTLMVISPYWYEGTWVFDDPRVGLSREPFVQGIPEMIDYLARRIPDARKGFRLTFSAHSFPGAQEKLSWVVSEQGGNRYRLEAPPMEGWLCPAMFRYFSSAPKHLYVRADPLD